MGVSIQKVASPQCQNKSPVISSGAAAALFSFMNSGRNTFLFLSLEQAELNAVQLCEQTENNIAAKAVESISRCFGNVNENAWLAYLFQE